MSHLFLVAVGAAFLYVAFRWIRREYDRVEASFRRTERRIKRKGSPSHTTLVFDPATGLYRPAK